MARGRKASETFKYERKDEKTGDVVFAFEVSPTIVEIGDIPEGKANELLAAKVRQLAQAAFKKFAAGIETKVTIDRQKFAEQVAILMKGNKKLKPMSQEDAEEMVLTLNPYLDLELPTEWEYTLDDLMGEPKGE